MTDKSNWQAGIDAYMQAGLSEEDAMKQAFLDIAIQIGWDFAGGALSGGIMGGGTSAIQKFDANTQAGKAVVANPGGVAALKQAATSTAMELDGSAQKSLNRLAGKVSTEQQTGKGLGSIVTKVRNAINTQRVGSLYNRTSDAITGLNATDFATRLERGGFTKQKASAVAKATIEAAAGYAVDGRAQALLESVWQDTAYQKALTETVKDDQSVISQRRDRIGQVLQERDTQVEKQENPSTFQEEVQRQFEEDNGYRQSVQKTYDIDEVFTAAQDARNSGAISEDRYNELLNNMQYAQSDYGEGNISEEQYYGTLETVMQQIGRYDAGKGDSAYSASATDPLVDVDRDTWQQAQRLAQALGRNIVFYNGARGENGYFKDGTIYVNILASDPFAQVFSHELTHSLDGTKHYEGLKRFVFSRLARSNIDIAQARKAKADQYQRHGKVLKGETEIDAEIVAEYVQTHLLTDEQSIMELVAAEPNVAKRIWKWATNLLRRMVGSQASRDRAELEHMERIYAKALRESRGDDAGAGTVSLRSQFASGEQTQVDDLVLARERTQWDYQEGRISDEEYDAAMDE